MEVKDRKLKLIQTIHMIFVEEILSLHTVIIILLCDIIIILYEEHV